MSYKHTPIKTHPAFIAEPVTGNYDMLRGVVFGYGGKQKRGKELTDEEMEFITDTYKSYN